MMTGAHGIVREMFLTFVLIAVSSTLASAEEIEVKPGSWHERVGATPFNSNDSLDISDFCSGTPGDDSTDCARKWIQAGKDSGRHLFASAGTYTLSKSLLVFSGMHVRCESPDKVIFRKQTNRWPQFFRRPFSTSPEHITDVLIENCAFDMNGDPGNFAAAITLEWASRVTVRGNTIFDSTGIKCAERDCQRQYVVILRATDILVENNRFSHGGRIKAGRPGRRIVIRNNILDFVNDNGITVVGRTNANWPDGTNISEDILIDSNRITDAIGTGIFFGSDGEPNGAGVTTRRLTVINNTVSGSTHNCIRGTLPDHAGEIFIGNNSCRQDKVEGRFHSGIGLGRSNNTSEIAEKVTAFRNRVEPAPAMTLHNGAFLVKFVKACLLENVVRNSQTAAWFKPRSVVYHKGNDWGGGNVRAESTEVEEIETSIRSVCFIPKFLHLNMQSPRKERRRKNTTDR